MKRNYLLKGIALFAAVLFLFPLLCACREEEFEHGGVVTKEGKADPDWFEDCLMIGNSRLVGMITYCGLKVGQDYTKNGFTVNSALRAPTEEVYNGKVTVSSAIENGFTYPKCCILFGVNEAGMETADDFRRDMNELLDILLSKNPETEIYVLTEYSVGADWEGAEITPEKIKAFNDVLRTLAAEKGAHLIDLFEPYATEDGYLLPEASADGLHMNVEYTKKMLDTVLAGIAAAQ